MSRQLIDRLALRSEVWESGSPAAADFLCAIGELKVAEEVQLIDKAAALKIAEGLDKYAWSDFACLVESQPALEIRETPAQRDMDEEAWNE